MTPLSKPMQGFLPNSMLDCGKGVGGAGEGGVLSFVAHLDIETLGKKMLR